MRETDDEAILKALDLELAFKRKQRESDGSSRMAFRIGSILVVIVALAIALMVLRSMTRDIPRVPKTEQIRQTLPTHPGGGPS